MCMKKIIAFSFLCLIVHACEATEWKLKKETRTMKIFTTNEDNSSYKSVKVECTVNAKFAQVIAALFDLDRQHEWVYNNKSSKLLKHVSDNELIYYSEVNVPWPCTNRDFIAHLKVTQPAPDVVNIESHSEPNYLPEKDGLVRVKSSSSHWVLTAIGNNQLKIEYTIQFDPSGSVPAWLTNAFVTKGPYETFDKLQDRINMSAYQNATFSFIKQ